MTPQLKRNEQTQRLSLYEPAKCDIHGHRITQLEKIVERHQDVLDRLLGLEGKATVIVWLLGAICVSVIGGLVALWFKVSN